MSDLRKENEEPDASSLPAGLDAIRGQFEFAWREALRDGAPPSLDNFVQQASEADRSLLRSHLALMDSVFQQRLANEQKPVNDLTLEIQGNSEVALRNGGCANGEENEPTLAERVNPRKALPPDTAHDIANNTLDFAPGKQDGQTAPSTPAMAEESGKTIGFTAEAGAVPVIGQTIDFQNVKPQLEETLAGPTSVSAQDLENGLEVESGPTITGYRVLGELGRGAMGVVYKAQQKGLHRLVALKMMLAGGHAGPEQLARFHTEAEAVARLQNPNIVQIYDVGEHEGLPYFSLEFVDGGTLQKKLGAKPQPPLEAAQMIETLALAMHCAHQLGIIHRDLKPANVLVTANGILKITDFGLAKRLEAEDSSQTRSGTLMGTPSYMSPEQARGDTHEIGPLADLYALGVMLYEMLTGRPPFQGASILDTLEQVRKHEPVPPSRLQPTVPRDLETICLKCLQKEPGKRYASTGELGEDLRRFQAGEPIQARPVGNVERAWRWCRRNPRVAVLSGVVALLIVAVASALFVMAGRAAREHKAIDETRNLAEQRLNSASAAVQTGNFPRAQDFLRWSDPLLENTAGLADLRGRLHELQAQVAVFAEFKEVLDNARYFGLFGSKGNLKKAQEYCQQVIDLYDQIEQRAGKGSYGLPPLNADQKQLFDEDAFEGFMVAANVAWSLAASGNDSKNKHEAARKALDWLNRAEKLLPPTRVLFKRRGEFWTILGDAKSAQQDFDKANKIVAKSAVDLFWNGFEEHLLGNSLKQVNPQQAQAHLHIAMAAYANLLRLRPENFWAYLDWATCQYELNQPYDAIVGFNTCIHIRPEVAWPYYNRGNIYLLLKQYDQAVQDYGEALKRNAHYAEAFYNRGRAYYEWEKIDLALQDINRAIELDAKVSPPYMQRAQIYRQRKEYAQAEKDYAQAIALNPNNIQAYKDRAAMYWSTGNFAKARADFAKVVAIVPQDGNAYASRGIINLLMKDLDPALKDWQTVARLLPNQPDAFYYMAIIHRVRRHYDQAVAALGKAMLLKPNHARYYLARAQVYHRQGKLQEARADLNLVLTRLESKDAEVWNDRGDLYRSLGRLDEAAQDYLHSLKLLPQQTDAYLGLALIYAKQGHAGQSRECYENMVAADPKSAKVYLRRAEYLRDLGQWDRALADCGKAAGCDAKSVYPALVRASILAARGNHAQAVAEAKKVLQDTKINGHVNYAAACIWSLASRAADLSPQDRDLAKKYADRAADFLIDALEKGFFDLNYQVIDRMADDPALAPLRQHPRVRDILKPPVVVAAKGK